MLVANENLEMSRKTRKWVGNFQVTSTPISHPNPAFPTHFLFLVRCGDEWQVFSFLKNLGSLARRSKAKNLDDDSDHWNNILDLKKNRKSAKIRIPSARPIHFQTATFLSWMSQTIQLKNIWFASWIIQLMGLEYDSSFAWPCDWVVWYSKVFTCINITKNKKNYISWQWECIESNLHDIAPFNTNLLDEI
jgi:hypothetical protein